MFEFHGEFYDLPPIKIAPVPSEPIPILIGGHSGAELRRAAQLSRFAEKVIAASAERPVDRLRPSGAGAGRGDAP